MPQSNKVVLKVTQRSAFDKSHYWDGAVPVGACVPLLVDEVIPHSTISLNAGFNVQLPPLATDAIAKIDFKVAAFFVPSRILYGGYESWFLDREEKSYAGGESTRSGKAVLPCFHIHSDMSETFLGSFGIGTLSDALGAKWYDGDGVGPNYSLMPYLAYHKIWNDFFRAPLVQEDIEIKRDDFAYYDSAGTGPDNLLLAPARMNHLFYDSQKSDYNLTYDETNVNNRVFDYADHHSIFAFRAPNYGYDYFTNAWPTAQSGSESFINTSGEDGFSISSLRLLNSFQLFKERNNYAPRFFEAVNARYGAHLSDAIAQRAVFLGSASYDLKNYPVQVTANNVGNTSDNQSPFTSLAGGNMGRSFASGADNLIDHFDTSEPGYIMVIGWISPRSVYSTGVNKLMRRYTKGAGTLVEMANPILQNIGNEPIFGYELNGESQERVFGYTDRYASFMTMPDRVFGCIRDAGGEYPYSSLSMFALQRSFDRSHLLTISSDFLAIKSNALDNILAYTSEPSFKVAITSAAFDYKVIQPLAEYSIPSLQDPAYEHGDSVVVHRGGLRMT